MTQQDIALRDYKVVASKMDRVADDKWFKGIVPKPRVVTMTPFVGKRDGIRMWVIDSRTLTKVYAALNKELAEVKANRDKKVGYLALVNNQKEKQSLQGIVRKIGYRVIHLERLREAIIKSVDLGSRPAVLGVAGPVVARGEVLPEYATYTVYIHTVDGMPVVFLGDRFGPAQRNGSAKTTKYETPTDLASLKSQMRSVIKAMRERNDPDLQRVTFGWDWISYKITGVVRKPKEKKA